MAEDVDRAVVMRMVFGQMAARTVATAVELGVVDRLTDKGRTPAELAAELDTHPTATLRLLRALGALGLLSEQDDDHDDDRDGGPGAIRFHATPAGGLLARDHPRSMADFVAMFTDPVMTASWERLGDAVRTGDTTFDAVFGVPFFDHLAQRPELSRTFNASMRQASRAVAATLPAAYDASWAGTVADIGGGDGTVLAALLAATPGARGILFDTAPGSAEAPEVLAAAGVADRVEVVHGDFFADAPTADLVLVKSVLHDWDDDRCATLLGHVRRRIPEGGRLVVIEPVLAERVADAPSPGTYLSDLNMLVNVGGRERTEAEFRDLFARGGFSLDRVVPLPAQVGFCLLEATPR
jgi:predicted O-methyltransferase YrrM